MLYLLRCIRLLDKERGWNVNAIPKKRFEAVNAMKAWLGYVRRQRDELPDAGATSKKTELRSLVKRMLRGEEARISASDLASQTVKWAA